MSNIFVNFNNKTELIIIDNFDEKNIDLNLFEKVDNVKHIKIDYINWINNLEFLKYDNSLINISYLLLNPIIKKCDLNKYNTFKIMFETDQYIKENNNYVNNPNYEYIWFTFDKLVDHKGIKTYNIYTSYNLILENYNKTFISKRSEPQTIKNCKEKYIIPVNKIMITNTFIDYITIKTDDSFIDIINNLVKDIHKNSVTIA